MHIMRKLLLLFTLLLASVVYGQGLTLPIDFGESQTYSFTDFNSAVTTTIINPDLDGVNTEANDTVAQFVRGVAPFSGSFLTLGDSINFSENRLFKVKVWAPDSGLPVINRISLIEDEIYTNMFPIKIRGQGYLIEKGSSLTFILSESLPSRLCNYCLMVIKLQQFEL